MEGRATSVLQEERTQRRFSRSLVTFCYQSLLRCSSRFETAAVKKRRNKLRILSEASNFSFIDGEVDLVDSVQLQNSRTTSISLPLTLRQGRRLAWVKRRCESDLRRFATLFGRRLVLRRFLIFTRQHVFEVSYVAFELVKLLYHGLLADCVAFSI